jgi:dTDP-4-dehydrorhamnose 3,5-epimerase
MVLETFPGGPVRFGKSDFLMPARPRHGTAMRVIPLQIPDIKVLTPKKFCDERGTFSETYNKKALADLGIGVEFVQDNQSASILAGTVRGLHFQLPPFAQDKLIGVLKGRIMDVSVDIRQGSPTFGQSVTVELSAEQSNHVWVPKGFAHGFCTLEPNTEVFYKVSDYYASEYDRGILWNDPDLGIKWPVSADEAVLAERDRSHPRLKHSPDLFVYACASNGGKP